MRVFIHHIYEFKKGLRNLILHTAPLSDVKAVVNKLKAEKIAYHIVKVSEKKINIFFGDENCVKTVKTINKNRLSDYTPEEDFILGIMLGYDRKKQCERYLDMKNVRFKLNKIS